MENSNHSKIMGLDIEKRQIRKIPNSTKNGPSATAVDYECLSPAKKVKHLRVGYKEAVLLQIKANKADSRQQKIVELAGDLQRLDEALTRE